MAKHIGPLKLKGTVSGVTFRQTTDGDVASKKSSLTKERVKTDPAFAGSRVASAALKLGGQYAGVVRRAFFKLLRFNSDSRVTSRLSGKFMKIIMQDMDSYPGERKVIPALLPQLKGFECNKGTSFSSIVPVGLKVAGDRTTGSWTVTIPAIETKAIKAPAGAKYYKIAAGVAAIDLGGLNGLSEVKETEWTPLKAHKEPSTQLSFQVAGAGELPVFTMATVSFAGEDAGEYYPLFDKSFNAGLIVGVDVVA